MTIERLVSENRLLCPTCNVNEAQLCITINQDAEGDLSSTYEVICADCLRNLVKAGEELIENHHGWFSSLMPTDEVAGPEKATGPLTPATPQE